MNVDDVARAVADALDASGIEYMLTGALAGVCYGISRSTLDVDFLVHMDATQVDALADALKEPFWLDPQSQFELHSAKTFRVIHVRKTPYQVDLFPLSDDPFDRSRFERRRTARKLDGRNYLWN